MRRIATGLLALAFLAGSVTFAGATWSGDSTHRHGAAHVQYEAKVKCNSGRGNGSELVNGVDCDPGNSGPHNRGGD